MRFLVVVGIALAVHAEPRFTKDLDVLVVVAIVGVGLAMKGRSDLSAETAAAAEPSSGMTG